MKLTNILQRFGIASSLSDAAPGLPHTHYMLLTHAHDLLRLQLLIDGHRILFALQGLHLTHSCSWQAWFDSQEVNILRTVLCYYQSKASPPASIGHFAKKQGSTTSRLQPETTLLSRTVTYTTPSVMWNCLPLSLEKKESNKLVLCAFFCLECLYSVLYRVYTYRVFLNLRLNKCEACSDRHTDEARTV